jgi:hypothetical protein
LNETEQSESISGVREALCLLLRAIDHLITSELHNENVSSQVVSAPSDSLLSAWLRIAMDYVTAIRRFP